MLPDPDTLRRLAEILEEQPTQKPMVAPENLVGMAEISDRLGVSRSLPGMWRQRYPSFPKPIAELRAGAVFDFTEVRTWYEFHLTKE